MKKEFGVILSLLFVFFLVTIPAVAVSDQPTDFDINFDIILSEETKTMEVENFWGGPGVLCSTVPTVSIAHLPDYKEVLFNDFICEEPVFIKQYFSANVGYILQKGGAANISHYSFYIPKWKDHPAFKGIV